MSEGPWVDSDRAEPALSVRKKCDPVSGRREGQGLHRLAAAVAPGLLVTDAVLPLRPTGVTPQELGSWWPGSSEDHTSLTRVSGLGTSGSRGFP